MTPKTEVSTTVRPVEALIQDLQTRAGAQLDGTQIVAASVDRIMTAATEDDLFEAAGIAKLTSSQDLENVPLRVDSLEVRASDAKYAKGGLGAFVVAQVLNYETGELLAMGTGAPKLVSAFVRAEQLGLFPWDVVIRGRETEGGTLLYLERAVVPAKLKAAAS